MARKPYISDYGGVRYDDGKKYRTPISSAHTSSFRCDSCGTLRFVTDRELQRAAKPRCLKCGGLLLETKTEAKRHEPARQPLDRTVGFRCAHCGIGIENNPISLSQHLVSHPDCFKHYRLNKPTTPVGAIYGTLFVERRLNRGIFWEVYGLLVTGKCDLIKSFDKEYLANDFIIQENENRE